MEKETDIIFVINSIDLERKIINMTKQNIDFFRKNKIIFTLPDEALKKEYNLRKYKIFKEKIEKEWKKMKINL